MKNKVFNGCNISHCPLYKFHKSSNVTAQIFFIFYVPRCSDSGWQQSFSKFKNGGCDLFDKPDSGDPIILANDLLKASFDVDLCSNARDLAKKGKMYDEVLYQNEKKSYWVLYKLSS